MLTQPDARARLARVMPQPAKERVLRGIVAAYGLLGRSRRPYEYLFVLSHMRAGSSLLAMLLGNSPEICGYGETFVTYRSPADLQRLVGNNLFRLQPLRLPGNERYMMDKLVFDRLLAVEHLPLLVEQGSKLIFLIRDPAGALRSIMPLAGGEETFAASVYIQRLQTLEQYGGALAGRTTGFLLSYRDLVERSESTLRSLATYLDLAEPLRERYEIVGPMRRSRASHFAKLHLGIIDGGQASAPEATIEPHNLAVAQRAFERCWGTLSAVCVTPGGDA